MAGYIMFTPIWAKLQPISPGVPAEVWGLDVAGPLPKTPKKNVCMITAIDYATRFATALPACAATTNQLILFLTENILYRFGTPRSWSLIEDQL